MTHWITPDWPAPAHIHAATTLRSGGVSKAEFASLNPALHVHDQQQQVLANRQCIQSMLALPSEPVWLQQTHSAHVICADQFKADAAVADASYTHNSHVVCAILSADCLPILLCDRQGSSIAAIHGGWRGLLKGIIANAVTVMPETELLAWLGPAIGQTCFEVGKEVYQAFMQQSAQFEQAFIQKNNDKYLADIYQIARILLNNAGVQHIYGGQFCTVTEKQRFFSYRRDGQTGRMATLIWKS